MPAPLLERSVGYQIRRTHRLAQRALQVRIEPHRVSLGMWYFLRALWDEDGLTQRELSTRVGRMEPTTMAAIMLMEKSGVVERKRNEEDRRKIIVYLTVRGRALEPELLPAGITVVEVATRSPTSRELEMLLGLLGDIQKKSDDLEMLSQLDDHQDLGDAL